MMAATSRRAGLKKRHGGRPEDVPFAGLLFSDSKKKEKVAAWKHLSEQV